MALFACCGPLHALSGWALALVIRGQGPSEAWRSQVAGWVMMAWLVVGLLGVLVMVVAVWPGRLWSELKRVDQYRLAVLTLVRWASIAMVARLLLAMYEAVTGPLFTGDLAQFNVARAVRPETLVSPTLPILFLGLPMYLWGLLNLWRLHQQAAGFGDSAPLIAIIDGRAPEGVKSWGPGLQLARELDDPVLWLRPGPALLVMVALSAQVVGVIRYGRVPDGAGIRWMLGLGTLLSLFLVGHAMTHSVALARTLLRALRALTLHPIASCFSRVGELPFLWRLSLGAPSGGELSPLVRQARAVREAINLAQAESGELSQIQDLVAPAVLGQPNPSSEQEAQLPFNATPAWRALLEVGGQLTEALERSYWRGMPGPTELAGKGQGLQRSPWREAEMFLALQVAYIVKHALVRVTRGLALVMAGLVLVLAAHLFYTFEGRGFWLGLDWVLVALGTVVAVVLLVAFEKDAILSCLWGSEPGKVGFRSEFVQRVLVYSAVPIVTLFVTFFPEVGSALFSWLGPFRSSLP